MPHLSGRRPSQLPQLGSRGGGWAILQGLLIAAVLLSALLGLGWPDGLELAASIVGGLFMALGALLLVVGALQLGSSLTPLPAPRAGQELSTSGLYGRARHPMYGGGILIALGWSTIFGSPVGLVLTVLLALFLELKARREEIWLLDRYPAYAEYRERTPRKFIPFLY
jgi:protein-S-isoprenylcysteine O-methyltransferase Ste14